MQQRAQDAAHVRVVIDNQKSQPVEINANHGRNSSGRRTGVGAPAAKLSVCR
jgi:hypothetical protein